MLVCFIFPAHCCCLLLPPLAPCSCMSYHHDSRRIFIGQDNGAVVVSEANSNKRLDKLAPGSLFWLLKLCSFKNLHICFGLGHNFNIWTPLRACGVRTAVWFETCFQCVSVCVSAIRSFSSLKTSTRWTTSKHIQVRTWDEDTQIVKFTSTSSWETRQNCVVYGVQLSSVGRVGVPCTEALSSPRWPQVRVLAWGPLLRVTPPLSLSTCFLSHLQLLCQ